MLDVSSQRVFQFVGEKRFKDTFTTKNKPCRKNTCSEELERSDMFSSIWNGKDSAPQNKCRISIQPVTIQAIA